MRIATAALFAALAAPLGAEETQRYLLAPRLEASTSRLRVAATAIAAIPRHRVRTFGSVGAYAADLTASEAAALAESGDLIVERVVPRYLLDVAAERPKSAIAPAADEAQETPWGITAIGAPQVWPHTRGENVNVVVVDTGVDPLQPDLVHAYAGGVNTVDPGQPPIDDYGHGTHVAGTIAAADNAFGVVGVAPRVKLWSAKVLDRNGDGSSEELVAAFAWTIEKARTAGGRWVVNLSIGGPDYSAIEERAAIDMIAAGIVVIAGAGNGGTEAGEFPTVMFPAGYRGVIAVGATNKNGGRAPFSSYGGGLALMAPGAAIRSTLRHGHFVTVEVKTTDGTTTPAWRIEGASYGSVTGKVYDCGVGDPENFPAAVRDNIALVRRGKHNFRELARNARDAGAAAVIIATYPDDVNGPYEWSFRPDPPDPAWDGYVFPVAVGMQHAAAEAILQSANDYTIDHITHLYGTMNGTSMSAPHVSGTAALLLSLAPELTPSWISAILRYTARDMDAPGWDAKTGAGAVDALKAAQWVAPETFGVPPQTPPKQGRRRSVR